MNLKEFKKQLTEVMIWVWKFMLAMGDLQRG